MAYFDVLSGGISLLRPGVIKQQKPKPFQADLGKFDVSALVLLWQADE